MKSHTTHVQTGLSAESYIGHTYGRLTITDVIEVRSPHRQRPEGMLRRLAICNCKCGTRHKDIRLDGILSGRVLSCGCFHDERNGDRMRDTQTGQFIPESSIGSKLTREEIEGLLDRNDPELELAVLGEQFARSQGRLA